MKQYPACPHEYRGATNRGDAFRCSVCEMVSYHPDDIEFGYCGHCHEFTGDGPIARAVRLLKEM